MKMMRPADHRYHDRKWAEKIADRLGNFWMPCPICREPFGGFEGGYSSWYGDSAVYYAQGRGMVVCAKELCERAARILNSTPQRIEWSKAGSARREDNDIARNGPSAEECSAALEQAVRDIVRIVELAGPASGDPT